jgi:hypothetical protein
LLCAGPKSLVRALQEGTPLASQHHAASTPQLLGAGAAGGGLQGAAAFSASSSSSMRDYSSTAQLLSGYADSADEDRERLSRTPRDVSGPFIWIDVGLLQQAWSLFEAGGFSLCYLA